MEIQASKVSKIKISGIINSHKLDPVSAFFEDHGPRQGEVTIKCYGKSWTAYWGGMGCDSVAEFFCQCDHHYIAGKMSGMQSDLDDFEAVPDRAQKAIVELRKDRDMSKSEARNLYNFFGESEVQQDEGGFWCQDNSDKMMAVFGDDWGYSIPMKPNPDYQYLCRIIDVVQEAVRPTITSVAA